MYKLYSTLQGIQLSGSSIAIEKTDKGIIFKGHPKFVIDPVQLATNLVKIDCGITVGFKERALSSDSCARCNNEDNKIIYYPELNRDEIHELDPTRSTNEQFPDVLFAHPYIEIGLQRAPLQNHYYILHTKIGNLAQTQVSSNSNSTELNSFCELYENTNATPESTNTQIYIGSRSRSRLCVIGCTNNILGSSGAGKSRIISEVLQSMSMQGGEKLSPTAYQRFMANVEDIRNVLIVADEPSLHFSLWYASGDYNYVMYGLTQRKLQTLLKYLVAKYTYDLSRQNRVTNKYKLLNIFIDSITEVIYAPSKVEREGEQVANTTFVKGISSSVKPEMLNISRSSGIIPDSNIIVTLINTANIPGTGNVEDETAFWNMISGNSPNAVWVYRHNIKQQRDRTKEIVQFNQSSENFLSSDDDYENLSSSKFMNESDPSSLTCNVKDTTFNSSLSISQTMRK